MAAPAAADHPGKLVQGEVVTDHADDFRGRKPLAKPLFTLRTKRAERRLRFKRRVSRKRLRARSTVKVRGRVRSRSIAVAKLGKPRTRVSARASSVDPGPRLTGVVLIRFSDSPNLGFTSAFARDKVFGNPDSANAYFQEASDGEVSLVGLKQPGGDVFGPYTVARGTEGCDDPDDRRAGYISWRNQALYQAGALPTSMDHSKYDHIIYVLPPGAGCPWSGLASVGGTWSMLNNELATWVVAHELGHNLDLDHASSDTCYGPGGAAVSLSTDCESNEYGDPYDAMGNDPSSRLFNATHRLDTTWLLGSQSRTVTQSGTYRLDPLYDSNQLTPGDGTRVLRVQRPDDRELHLEVRRPHGTFDDYSPNSSVAKGLSVRIDRGPAVPGEPYDDRTTHLLDMNPSTSSFYDSALQVGQTFNDPISTTTITLEALDPLTGVATVSVDLDDPGPAPPPNAPPPDPDTGGGTTTPPTGGGTTKPPVTLKPVTLVPVRAVGISRSRARGKVSRLARADGRVLSVRGRRGRVRFEARFARVPSRSGRLKLALRARASSSCRGRAEIYVPGSRRWVRLGKVSLRRRSRTLNLVTGGAGSRYVSRGRVVKVRFSCAARRLRTLSADMLRLTAS